MKSYDKQLPSIKLLMPLLITWAIIWLLSVILLIIPPIHIYGVIMSFYLFLASLFLIYRIATA